jgi:hypothetical protein
MRVIGKKFDYQHGIELITACKAHSIRTQACLLVGHPDETEGAYNATKDYLVSMVKAGLDEVAVFVVASFAGSALFSRNSISLVDQSALASFSPKGRAGYETLERRRKGLIRAFFIHKLLRGVDLWLQGLRAILGIPQTKMENLPRRIAYIYWVIFRHHLASRTKRT